MALDSSTVFLSFGVLGSVSGLLVQRYRSNRAAATAEARFEAVLAERARLARGLHDTLLQRFTGITLQIDGVRQSLRLQSSPLADDLARILDQADQILAEAREMIGVAWGPPGSPSADGFGDR